MAKPQVYQINLDVMKEPDDLWGKFFFTALKNFGEQNRMNIDRINALEDAIAALTDAVNGLSPQPPAELSAAMNALKDVHAAAEQQNTRSLANIEKLAVLGKQIAASQKGG